MKALKRNVEFIALPLKFDEESAVSHTIYFKEHAVREHTNDKPAGRTLLSVNIPPYADEIGLKNAFKKAGDIKAVYFSEKPSTAVVKPVLKFIEEQQKCTFKAAYIVFEKVSGLDKALQLTELCPLNSEDHQVKVGLSKWIDEYNSKVILPKTLKEEVELFMKRHDSRVKTAEKKEKELEEADDDGWVMVTKGGKIQNFARTEKVENKILAKEDKKNKRKELKNFYTFQIRESKMKHIVSLRQKFEEDKKKIAQIKQSRRFKPF